MSFAISCYQQIRESCEYPHLTVVKETIPENLVVIAFLNLEKNLRKRFQAPWNAFQKINEKDRNVHYLRLIGSFFIFLPKYQRIKLFTIITTILFLERVYALQICRRLDFLDFYFPFFCVLRIGKYINFLFSQSVQSETSSKFNSDFLHVRNWTVV